MISEETKKSIDSMGYESMLSLWRNAPSGHPMFQGDVGDYYAIAMKKKRSEISDADHVAASKNIGWNG